MKSAMDQTRPQNCASPPEYRAAKVLMEAVREIERLREALKEAGDVIECYHKNTSIDLGDASNMPFYADTMLKIDSALRGGKIMTPARKKALQWFYDRGDLSERCKFIVKELSGEVVFGLVLSGHIRGDWSIDAEDYLFTLTDKGRRALNGETK